MEAQRSWTRFARLYFRALLRSLLFFSSALLVALLVIVVLPHSDSTSLLRPRAPAPALTSPGCLKIFNYFSYEWTLDIESGNRRWCFASASPEGSPLSCPLAPSSSSSTSQTKLYCTGPRFSFLIPSFKRAIIAVSLLAFIIFVLYSTLRVLCSEQAGEFARLVYASVLASGLPALAILLIPTSILAYFKQTTPISVKIAQLALATGLYLSLLGPQVAALFFSALSGVFLLEVITKRSLLEDRRSSLIVMLASIAVNGCLLDRLSRLESTTVICSVSSQLNWPQIGVQLLLISPALLVGVIPPLQSSIRKVNTILRAAEPTLITFLLLTLVGSIALQVGV